MAADEDDALVRRRTVLGGRPGHVAGPHRPHHADPGPAWTDQAAQRPLVLAGLERLRRGRRLLGRRWRGWWRRRWRGRVGKAPATAGTPPVPSLAVHGVRITSGTEGQKG
jgi:hypothetical protein